LSTPVKPLLFEQFARIGRALSHGQRLELLELLAQAESPVDALARTMNLPVANVSQHLKQLKQAGLVVARRDGRSICYQLAGPEVAALLLSTQAVARKVLGEVDSLVQTWLSAKDALEPVAVEEVLRRARDGVVTVLDVRPAREFAAGHLPGAVNIPLDELDRRLAELPRDREVAAYCRGAYCVLSYDAVQRLRAAGLTARRVEDGIPEWLVAGQVLESSEPA
jgi:rhodanese-related sulfurtransferase/biotin operon repressor